MNSRFKRILSLTLAFMLTLSFAPTAMAQEVGAAPELPTATVTEIQNKDLTFAMNFVADQITDEQLAYYGDWFADFELTINKDVTFDANGTGDGWLSGQYDGWSKNWVNVPFNEPVTLEAGQTVKIMEFAAKLLGEPGLKYTYREVFESVGNFDCGVYFTPDFLEVNPDLKVTLELRMYDPADETQSYIVGQTYEFKNDFVACNTTTNKVYDGITEAILEAREGETVALLRDVEERITSVLENVKLDLNGHTLTSAYVTCFGDIIDSSENNAGLLKVEDSKLLIQDQNEQLPVKDGEGYRFVEVLKFNQKVKEGPKYIFQPLFEEDARALLKAGKDATGVSVMVRVSWTQSQGTRTQDFVFNDAMVKGFIDSYGEKEEGKYGQQFALTLLGNTSITNLTFTAVVRSDTGVEFTSADTQDDTTGGETGNVTVKDNKVAEEVTINNNQASAVVPEGTLLQANTTNLTLTVKEVAEGEQTNITLGENEVQKSVDVHIDGIAEENTVPMTITLPEFVEPGLNLDNIHIYHIEDGASVKMERVMSVEDFSKHNQYYYDPATGDVVLYMATFSEVAAIENTVNAWNGSVDHSWYEGKESPYYIANADQLWSFSQIVGGMADGIEQDSFAGKTVTLLADINLGDDEENNNDALIFYPIGYHYTDDKNGDGTTGDYYSTVSSFEGTFDGNGHTISNFYQNTWEIKGDYSGNYYSDAMGLFGYVVNGKIMNLTVDNFSSDGEFTPTGVIAAYAVNSTFENIAITNCNPRVYNTGNGGIVGIGGNSDDPDNYKLTFTNITIDNTNKITALWGSWDVACGGLVGMFRGAGHVYMTNCHVAAQIDVYNDVCGNYQYYWYRYAGMMVGTNKNMVTDDKGYTVPETDKFHAEDCTVHFGEWNDYYYCELVANSLASYTHDHQFSRLTEVKAVNGNAITYLDGTTGTAPASGWAHYVVVNGEASTENATCYHFKDGKEHNHNDYNGDGEEDKETINGQEIYVENNRHIYLPFNQLFTGYGWGVKHIPVYNGEDYAFEGITILDRPVADSVKKFDSIAQDSYITGKTVTIGELFQAADIEDGKLTIKGDKVQVTVSPVGETSTASGTYVADTTDWTKGTLTFTGTGAATITITDYYFCTPTTIPVNITEPVSVEKFASKIDRDYEFLYRVGNLDKFPVGVLFEAMEGAVIDTANVEVTVTSATEGITGTYTANTTDWTKGTLKINGAGLVTISITDKDNCKPTSVTVEVIAAKNAYSGTVPDATSTNVVLLEDVSDNGFTVSGKHFYGNGFTVTCAGNGAYGNVEKNSKSLNVGYVTVESGGTLDNVKIICNTFPESYMFTAELVASGTQYPYSRPAVTVSGNSTISGCYIYGARVNILVRSGNVTIQDTVTDSGALANIHIDSQSGHTVTLHNVTTIQKLKTADFDSTKKVLGFAVAVGTTDSTSYPTIKLTGDLRQYNWVTQTDANAATGTYSSGIISGALAVERYQHKVNGETAVNLGIAFVLKDLVTDGTIVDERSNKTDIPYQMNEVTMKIMGNNLTGKVYSIVNSETAASRNDADADNVVGGMESTNSAYIPQFAIDPELGGQYIANTTDCDEYCYVDDGTVEVMFVAGDTKEMDLAALVDITKYTGQTLTPVISCVDSDGNEVTIAGNVIALSEMMEYTVTYTVTDQVIYEQDGEQKTETSTFEWKVPLSVQLKDKAVPNAIIDPAANTATQIVYNDETKLIGAGDYVQFVPFLNGIRIYDYVGQEQYTRFDGDKHFGQIAKVTLSVKEASSDAGNHVVTVQLVDGGVITIDLAPEAIEGGSKEHTGSVKVLDDVLYFVNAGKTSAIAQTWKIYNYSFVGNNGVTVNTGLYTFGSSYVEDTTAPSDSFGTTINYTVTYDANGGNCGQTVGYATSKSPEVTLPTPTRRGYIFEGWFTAADGGSNVDAEGSNKYTPTGDITLYAHWGEPCTVTYNANGGKCDATSATYSGEALILPAATHETMNFVGWYDAVEGGNLIGNADDVYRPKEDITLYAHWSNKVSVTYVSSQGAVPAPEEVDRGTEITLPTLENTTEYRFDGWNIGGTAYKAGDSYTANGSVTINAVWSKYYTITVSTTNATVNGVENGEKACEGDTITFTVTYSGDSDKKTTVKDASGNTVSTTGSYTFTMPASNVTIEATSSCITADTLITLADGSQVRVDSLTGGEELLVWNLETGKLDSAPILFIDSESESEFEVVHLYFSDGTDVKVIYEHGFWDYDLNKYVYLDRYAQKYIGHTFAKRSGEELSRVQLTDVVIETEVTTAWSPVTAGHLCYFVNGMLSMPGGVGGLFNIFEVDPETMTYDPEAMQRDIETYGLYTYEEMNEIVPLPEEMFETCGGAYLKVSIGKGNMTIDDLIYMVNRYRAFF